jgi:hypothetical protein
MKICRFSKGSGFAGYFLNVIRAVEKKMNMLLDSGFLLISLLMFYRGCSISI